MSLTCLSRPCQERLNVQFLSGVSLVETWLWVGQGIPSLTRGRMTLETELRQFHEFHRQALLPGKSAVARDHISPSPSLRLLLPELSCHGLKLH